MTTADQALVRVALALAGIALWKEVGFWMMVAWLGLSMLVVVVILVITTTDNDSWRQRD